MTDSPASILYDGYGNPLAVRNGVTIPSNTSGLFVACSDGTNVRHMSSDSSGRPIVVGAGTAGSPSGGVLSIQGVSSGTNVPVSVSGTVTISGTVTSNQGTPASLSNKWVVQVTDGTNTMPTGDAVGRAIFNKITDGTNTATVTGSSALKIDGSAVTQPVSGTITANAGTGNFTVIQGTASNLLANVGGLGASGASVVGNPVRIGGSDGTNARDILVDSSGRQIVIGAASSGSAVAGNPVLIGGSDGTNARTIKTATDGTVRIDPTGTTTQPVSGTITANQGGTWTISGDTAHDAVDSGNPLKIGFKASSALPTAVSNSDRANGISDLWGRQLISHIDPAMFVSKSFNATTTQTGTDVWSPASGKKIAVTSVVIGTYDTTAGRVILWFGDNADTTYTPGTDQVLLAASFAPSTTSKPGLVFTPASPIFCNTADRELHCTTDAGISIDITVHGYEF